MKTEYVYGMRNRGFSLGCQPMDGFVRRKDCVAGYHDLLVYNRKLTEKEVKDYELVLVKETLYHVYDEVKVQDVNVGETFVLGKTKWVKLDNSHGGCLCLSADVLFNDCFDKGNQNDWATSSLRKNLVKIIGEYIENNDALVPFIRDLTTDDGMTEYGSCTDVVSLLTCNEYRKYRKLIPNCGQEHWTITADSPKYLYHVLFIRFIDSDGCLGSSYAYTGRYGVRPLIVLKSDTLVTVAEE